MPANDGTSSRPARQRRTWSTRAMLGLNLLACSACFLAASVLLYAHSKDRIQRQVVEALEDRRPLTPDVPSDGEPSDTLAAAPDGLAAQNWLLTGSDARDCIDPNSPYANAFLAESVDGSRSDTIMVLRFDPSTGFAAAVSFPRDLWVKIGGSSRQARINSAYDSADPSRLIETIEANFGVPIDHWADVNFCAFAELVDAVNGVSLRFEYPTKDTHSGLNVPVAECHRFSGEEAVAYVRSRHYSWFDGTVDRHGRPIWQQDPTSDIGRAHRQQEFIRAIAQRALDTGMRDPRRFDEIVNAFRDNVTVDHQVSNRDIGDLALHLVRIDPASMQTYVVQASNTTIDGAAVLRIPKSGTMADQNEAAFAIFRGEAPAGPPVIVPSLDPAAPVTMAPALPVVDRAAIVPQPC